MQEFEFLSLELDLQTWKLYTHALIYPKLGVVYKTILTESFGYYVIACSFTELVRNYKNLKIAYSIPIHYNAFHSPIFWNLYCYARTLASKSQDYNTVKFLVENRQLLKIHSKTKHNFTWNVIWKHWKQIQAIFDLQEQSSHDVYLSWGCRMRTVKDY